MKKYAFIVFDNCAIWQVTLLQKFLRDKGWEFDVLSLDGNPLKTDGGMSIQVDYSIEKSYPHNYNLILLPGGDITSSLLESESLKSFLKEFNGTIAASCASAVLLASANLIKGNFTSMPHIKEHFSSYFSNGTFLNTDVCVNENIITSKGFAHYEFMMAVLEKLGLTSEDPVLEKIALKLSRNA